MSNFILLCTVGGSHQPVLEAIRSNAPDYICFFCTDKDPDTGKTGSISQVIGNGAVINAKPSDPKPTLPNLTILAKLNPNTYETCIVPADDLDGAFLNMRNAVTRLAKEFSEVRFLADYTGGTKTMTAALVCVALDRDDMELQLVSGARPDLVRVAAGTEQAMTASVARLRLDRAMAPYREAWVRYSYREAADGLDRIRIDANDPDRERCSLALALSRAFARWDDFDHSGALELIEPFAGRVVPSYPSMLPTLRILTDGADKKHTPAHLFDLWLNAQRRASQGRYDDAVARVYRLIEWTAQWLLRTKLDVDTADVPADLLPRDADMSRDTDGKIKLGLWRAWQVLGTHMDGPARDFMANRGEELRDCLSIRNRSILAHGFAPVRKEDWERVCEWTGERFLPVLKHYACETGLKTPPNQVPTYLPDGVRGPV